MLKMMVEAVQHPAVLWTVLAGSIIAVAVEAFRTNPEALWGDMIRDESEDI